MKSHPVTRHDSIHGVQFNFNWHSKQLFNIDPINFKSRVNPSYSGNDTNKENSIRISQENYQNNENCQN